MAHIVKCMTDPEPDKLYIAMPSTSCSQSIDPSRQATSTPSPLTSEKPFVWRMQPESRKYQLFPKERSGGGKSLDPEQAYAMVMGQGTEKPEKQSVASGLKLRIREHSLNRRRKISVPDLGPMTTVQEVPMDSPTIPGRPAVHERSISAPGAPWKQNHLAECIAHSPTKDDIPVKGAAICTQGPDVEQRGPLSPKALAPLVIPKQNSSTSIRRQISFSRLRSGSTPVESARSRSDESSATRTLFTPLSTSTCPRSATTMTSSTLTASTIPTPISAPAENRASPRPWEKSTASSRANPPDSTITHRNDVGPRGPPPGTLSGHPRQTSDASSMMDRGRPRMRNDTHNNNGPLLKKSGAKRTRSAERKAFEQLPKGWKGEEAINMLCPGEVSVIQNQAWGQACRFEILRKEDVDNLSRELRHLDERTEYLRRTCASLRAGRRNLHSRICQYLRSPRTAKFSHESILRQEESLSELDTSIDDWVNKLEQAENRRTRVRQKLLEHVAAAAILPVNNNGNVAGVSQTMQQSMGFPLSAPTPADLSTPPRSPTTCGTESPQQSDSRFPQRVVAQVPSTILEQPLVEEAAALSTAVASDSKRMGIESIRVYADSEVYTLFQDVENEIAKMSNGDNSSPSKPKPAETKSTDLNTISEEEHKQLHRAWSHELLNGVSSKPSSTSTTPTSANSSASNANSSASSASSLPISPPAPSPPAKDTPPHDGGLFLTAAVFKPSSKSAAAA